MEADKTLVVKWWRDPGGIRTVGIQEPNTLFMLVHGYPIDLLACPVLRSYEKLLGVIPLPSTYIHLVPMCGSEM